MPIDPEARKILDLVEAAGRPEYWELEAAVARANHDKAFPVLDIDPVPLKRIDEQLIDAPAGGQRIRLYWPDDVNATPGAMLWIHGGGHVVGSLECYEAVCRYLARESGHVVVAAQYRLAPEHKFPAAVEDALNALAWLAGAAGGLGLNPERLMVGGDSAGGNLAAVTALLARDHPSLNLCHQLLIYPVTASWPDSESHRRYGEKHLLTRKNIEWFQRCYLASDEQRQDFRFAPLAGKELEGLPAATVIVAECDPLHDEGVAYAEAMRAAGNQVDLIDFGGMLHGFLNMGSWLFQSRQALAMCADLMRHKLDAVGAAAADTGASEDA